MLSVSAADTKHVNVSVCVCLLLQRFRPITVEKPKVLLPLVNAPLLEYTLEWLALNQVEEVRGGGGGGPGWWWCYRRTCLS